ncbi:MAG TPA: hypothetical protein VFS41_07690 [Edaphobacter sp.]|nr:hypothetical protein [Edaphobacter sp.]
MSTVAQTALAAQVEAAAKAAGLVVVSVEEGKDFSGGPTARFTLALASNPAKKQTLELSAGFDFSQSPLKNVVDSYMQESATRLKNPRPDCYLTLHGIPFSFGKFEWPFHASTSGADTYIVHGEARLEDGNESVLHAKVSASLTRTFAEVVPALEQPFAESFIYNAVRKTTDQGQIELVKSGNRQPVPVTTRYYSTKQKRFIFNDTTESQRMEFLAAKVFWLSGILGGDEAVWLTDPRDAQYLNTTVEDLRKVAQAVAHEGIIRLAADTDFATPTEALMGHRDGYFQELDAALKFLKPSFNEEMRAGHTNM